MRPRFRLRTLFALTAVAAAGCYLWVARPTVLANRFVAAVNRNDYLAADALFQPGPLVPDEFKPLVADRLRLTARLEPRTWHDFVHGCRRIELQYAKGSVVILSPVVPLRGDVGSDIQTPHHCGSLTANASGVALARTDFPQFYFLAPGGMVMYTR
jgi:hypothetical protein